MKTVLITGAGTGFGNEAAMRLAKKGFDVIAAVEIYPQVEVLENQAKERGVKLKIEKLDVTGEGDRKKALDWNVEILVNNAGMLEGGSIVDIPGYNMRHEFEVNVIGPLLLTQGIAKQMIKRGEGRIVWVSSREGINVNPFTGIYSASKHAIEAIAQTMKVELQEFNIEWRRLIRVPSSPDSTIAASTRGRAGWMTLPSGSSTTRSSPSRGRSSIRKRYMLRLPR